MTGHFLSAALQSSGAWALAVDRTHATLVRRLEVAGDSGSRRKGLLGRESLDRDTGFVIAPTQGVQTFGMRFPIDIVGVSRDGRVVKIRERVPPRRLVFAWTAFAILELAAGVAAGCGLVVGDRLKVLPAEPSA